MSSMRVIGLDIETSNLDMDADGLSFGDPNGWNTSCVSIYDHHRKATFHYVADPDSLNLSEEPTNVFPFSFLAHDLEEWFYSGYLLITKNGTDFDLPIIMKSTDEGGCGEAVARHVSLFLNAPTEKELPNGTIRELQPKHIDICLELREQTGSRHRLQHLIQGTFGSEESKLMDAAEAPENWAAGHHQTVLDYCGADARYTADLFFYGRREQRLYTTEETKPLRVRW